MKIHILSVGAFLLLSLSAATPVRDWKVATLTATAYETVDHGNQGMLFSVPGAPIMTNSLRILQTSEGFLLETDDYVYMVSCPIYRGHTPNVTINGTLKYAIDKGKFYMIDDDAKQFSMTVLKKIMKLQQQPAPELPK